MRKFSEKINRAVIFAEKAHRGQKRKGSDVSYIVHPLCVAMILSGIGADDDLICSALLHDVVEDCNVSFAEIEKSFGNKAMQLVKEVTEDNKTASWKERKRKAEEKIKEMSNDALLLKSADIIHNTGDLLYDIKQNGESAFSKFNAPKKEKLEHCVRLVSNLEDAWPENPLLSEVQEKRDNLIALS